MKRLFLITLLFAISATTMNAQRSFRFGMKAAPLFSWIKPDFRDAPKDFAVEGGGGRIGFVWGPMAEIQLNETFLISTGLDINYTSGKLKGTLKDSLGNLVDWNQLYKTRFIELPVMLKFRTKEIGYLRYFGLFGMGAGFRYSAKTEFSRTLNSTTVTNNDNNSDTYVNVFRGSMLVGAGVEYSLSGNTAMVGSLLFNNSLTNMFKNQTGDYITDPFNTIRENGIMNYMQLNIGILF
ncbi:MAG TPA: porin family protein [Flavobacteriales bacterium]|nr:porin family protein [Flavobacteriales bacterium]